MFCWSFPAIVLSGSGMLVSEDQTRIEWKAGDRDLMTFSYGLREEVLNHMIGNQVDF